MLKVYQDSDRSAVTNFTVTLIGTFLFHAGSWDMVEPMRGWPSFRVGGLLGYSGPSLVYDIEFGVCQNQMNHSRRQLTYD